MASSLFDLSLRTFCESLKDATEVEYLPLPRSFKQKIRNEIKKLWGSQRAVKNVDDYNYSNIELWDLTRVEFNMIMNHPYEVPEFVFENNHVVWNYYIWEGENFYLDVCFICCRRLYYMSDEQAEMFWGMKKTTWKFFHNTNHKKVEGSKMLDEVIWDLNNYCDICVIQSLFQIYSEERCRDELAYHWPAKNDSDSSTDEYDHSSQSLIRHAPRPPPV